MEHHVTEEQALKNFIAFKRKQKAVAKAAKPKMIQAKLVKDPFAMVHRLPFHSLIALDQVKTNYLRKSA